MFHCWGFPIPGRGTGDRHALPKRSWVDEKEGRSKEAREREPQVSDSGARFASSSRGGLVYLWSGLVCLRVLVEGLLLGSPQGVGGIGQGEKGEGC